MMIPNRQIRAEFSQESIRVYQAYSDEIAENALKAQVFMPPFKKERMTWIKPSFLWMMYRSGWGTKLGQERILAIDIAREGFEWALSHACLSHFDPKVYESRDHWVKIKKESPVRVQWDPERDHNLERLEHRTIQIGLMGEAVELYVSEWTKKITDVTKLTHEIHDLISTSDASYLTKLPSEKEYLLPKEISLKIGMLVVK